jgi:hypothetical protein
MTLEEKIAEMIKKANPKPEPPYLGPSPQDVEEESFRKLKERFKKKED